jgi:glutamate racemase
LIGIFDSGVGGLSVLSEIRKQLPQENFIYIADSAFTPYGDKSEADITARCIRLVEYLVDQHADVIVVACNTATAIAINSLRKKFSLPIVAMEPGLKPAIENSSKGKVGILATTMTLSSHRYAHLLERFASGAEVIEQACPGLVEKVERMQIASAETSALLHHFLDPLLKNHVDTVVLGCTHYPFLRKQIEDITGQHVKIIDTAAAVTRELVRRLQTINRETTNINKPGRFITTGSAGQFQAQLDYYWPEKVSAETVQIQ